MRLHATLAITLLLTAACLSPTPAQPSAAPPTQAAATPIKIGVLQSFGGVSASTGLNELNGINFFVDEVNARGGVKGRQLRIVKRDDNSDPAVAVQQIRDLSNDREVVAIIGPTGSGAVLAAKPVIEEIGIPVVSAVSRADLTKPTPRWFFRSYPEDVLQNKGVLRYLKSKGVKRLALVNADDAFGQSAAANYKNFAPEFDIEVVSHEVYPPGTTDPSIQIIRAKASNPDAYIIWDGLSSSRLALALKAARQQGISDKPIMLPESASADQFVKAAGVDATGALFFSQFATEDPRPGPQKVFVDTFRAKFGEPPSQEILGYISAQVVARGVEIVLSEGKQLARASLRDAIESIKEFDTAVGKVTFGPDKHDPVEAPEIQINVFKDGKRLRAP